MQQLVSQRRLSKDSIEATRPSGTPLKAVVSGPLAIISTSLSWFERKISPLVPRILGYDPRAGARLACLSLVKIQPKFPNVPYVSSSLVFGDLIRAQSQRGVFVPGPAALPPLLLEAIFLSRVLLFIRKRLDLRLLRPVPIPVPSLARRL